MNCILVAVGGLFGEDEESVFDWRGDRMENDGEIGERCPLLNTFRRTSHPSVVHSSELPKRKQTLNRKRKAGAWREERRAGRGGSLVQIRKASQSGRLKETDQLSF